MKKVIINGNSLTVESVVAVSRDRAKVALDPKIKKKIAASRNFVEELVKNKAVVYGLTTGFGSYKDVSIDESQTAELQHNLITSHAVGVGDPLSEEEVRAAILIRINSLSKGVSGIRLVVIETLIEMLNKNVYPYVPQQGSVGSSGDLAPLSHIMLVLLGIGEAFYKGKRISGADAMKKAGIKPIQLSSKEGLALNNGTAVMTGITALALYDAEILLSTSDVTLAMTLESIHGVTIAFNKQIHEVRPHPGQIQTAENIRKLIKGSYLLKNPSKNIQDSYSMRCAPQVHGASKDTIAHVRTVVERELNSATDNPLIFADLKKPMSAGNFHGEPIAQAADILGIGVAEIGTISERRIAKLVDPETNGGLPIFLITKEAAGLNNGFMMPQYTAAALASENKVIAHPASVDTIPTSVNQEDHVSMGTIAARTARDIVRNVKSILAIEAMAAAQAMDLRRKFKMPNGYSPNISSAYNLVRKHSKFWDKDRIFYPEIHAVADEIHAGKFAEILSKA